MTTVHAMNGRPPAAFYAIAANELNSQRLSDEQVADLVAFLGSLTDESSRDLEHLVPQRVPSGLPVED